MCLCCFYAVLIVCDIKNFANILERRCVFADDVEVDSFIGQNAGGSVHDDIEDEILQSAAVLDSTFIDTGNQFLAVLFSGYSS